MRDPFSAGGQGDLEVNGVRYEKLPQKYLQLFSFQVVRSTSASAPNIRLFTLAWQANN